MNELQKRAGRALVALLQNDAKTALKELQQAGELDLADGEPIIYPTGLAFGYSCQVQNRIDDPVCGGTVHSITIGRCDKCHAKHYSSLEEKRYCAYVSKQKEGG